MRTRLSLCLSLTLLFLAGCGSGAFSKLTPPISSSSTPSLISIAVTSASGSITVGQSNQLTATAKYSDGSTKNVTASVSWSSSSAGIATVSKSGLMTALAAGQVKIAATLDVITGSMSFNVTHTLVSLSVTSSGNVYSTSVGSSLQFNAFANYNDGTSINVTGSALWTSSATTIASISSSGLLTPIAAGNAQVQAIYSEMTGSANVSVTDNLLSLSINASSNGVNVGSSLQLTAMGTYQDGKPPRAVNGVTWSSSAANLASVNNAGLVSGLKKGTVTVTASIASLSASIQLSVSPVLRSIVVTPVGPGLQVGGQQQFHALGNYDDGSTQDLTTVAQWSSSDASTASPAPGGLVTAVSAGLVTINASSTGITGSTALNVVNSIYAAFTGPYAFNLIASSTRSAAFFAGSISADPQGNISGVEDSNTPAGVQQNIAVSGTSVIYPDGRGILIFKPNACHPSGITLRFVLSSSGNSGSLIEFDGLGSAKGSLELQNPAAFNAAALNGTYVFRAAGVDSGNNSTNLPQPFGMVGMFTASGTGSVISGMEDANDFGTVSLQVPLNTSNYTVGANGRGTLQLSSALGTTNYAIYVIGSTKLYVISADAAPANAVLGLAELQTAQAYDAASLSGYYVFQVDQPVQANSGDLNYFDFEQIGRFDLDGAGNMDGVRDGETMTGGYTVSNNSVNGRGMFSSRGTMPGQTATDYRFYLFYVVSPSQLFILQCYSSPTASSLTGAIGEADMQTGMPYSTASLSGSYSMTAFDMTLQTESLMWLNFGGAGSIQGISDVGSVGIATSTVIANPQFLATPDTAGFTNLELTTSVGMQQYDLYLESPTEAFTGTLDPPTYGRLDQQ
ncbi:MAG TPA: Ig-like domain-containing protein [Candidatus Aquilonibacter sp.]|nr:Ig-like domain-containing protein [Candidatus Aquilonibacter sp.]